MCTHSHTEHGLLMLAYICTSHTHTHRESQRERNQLRNEKLRINATYETTKRQANSRLIETMVSDYNLFTIYTNALPSI